VFEELWGQKSTIFRTGESSTQVTSDRERRQPGAGRQDATYCDPWQTPKRPVEASILVVELQVSDVPSVEVLRISIPSVRHIHP
jgi:hypothetical protein